MTAIRVLLGLMLMLVGLGFALVGVMSMGDGTIVIVPSLAVAAAGAWLMFRHVAGRHRPS